MLQANETLKYLDISSNSIRDDGIKPVARSIQFNTTLVQLKVFNCECTEDIDKMLTVNKTLGITYTNDDVTNTALETFCMSNCELRQLNIAIDHTNNSFMIIAEYVDEVNHASIAANSTADYNYIR